ncbi:Protein patched/dispatched [Trinorchestia longiramus]|nr:Protein patched/dispatched [Trinorchestia longiramus]
MSVLMTYVWHITLFGGFVALSGHAKKKLSPSRKSSPSRSLVEEKPLVYRSCCARGISLDDTDNPEDNRSHAIRVFFRDYVAVFLSMPKVKGLTTVYFVVYMSIAIYGWTVIGDGMELSKIVRYDSFTVPFDAFQKKYFKSFGYRPMIIFTGNITYNDPATEKAILNLIDKAENHILIGDPLFSDCWLRKWSEFMNKNDRYLKLNNSDEKTFIRNLKEYFLAGESNNFRLDVVFNDDNSSNVASRCIVQAVNVLNDFNDKKLMEDLRRFADESAFNVTIFHNYMVFLDHLTLIRTKCLITASCAAVIMVVIAFIFIPNPFCSLWVGLSVGSIETGVIGYMGLWGVNFDVMSMIQLIMCIGFSVDFTAHICYAYLSSQGDILEKRLRESLDCLGLPIMQTALSTFLGVLILMLVPSYLFVTFFKTVFMVTFFGTLHGIYFVPVFLSLVDKKSFRSYKGKNFDVGEEIAMRNSTPVVSSSHLD